MAITLQLFTFRLLLTFMEIDSTDLNQFASILTASDNRFSKIQLFHIRLTFFNVLGKTSLHHMHCQHHSPFDDQPLVLQNACITEMLKYHLCWHLPWRDLSSMNNQWQLDRQWGVAHLEQRDTASRKRSAGHMVRDDWDVKTTVELFLANHYNRSSTSTELNVPRKLWNMTKDQTTRCLFIAQGGINPTDSFDTA